MINNSKLTYQASGVDYNVLDPVKILAQTKARETGNNLAGTAFAEVPESRGESAHVVDCGGFYLASITECLGTKVLVADATRKITGKTYYDLIAQDTIACAVNDVITVGAKPLTVHAYWAAGSAKWFDDSQKVADLINGWKKTCGHIGAIWGGGETPVLQGIVSPDAIDLAASCVGIIKPKDRLVLGKNLQDGDVIIALESIGIQSNGVSLARKLAAELPDGYGARLPDGTLYGEALLKPTLLYSPVIEAIQNANIKIHYISNITGHGWRKIMRHSSSFTYRITYLPPAPPVLDFIVKQGKLDLAEAYSTFNMGIGFAIFTAPKDAKQVAGISQSLGIKAYQIGVVERGEKKVCLEPLKITFEKEALKLRD
ncbi:MAG: phosphoribosylformylglycinamidine cyclo-ligase [Firmicutes bacterium]|nr:phosphoribosylformylglycinamidine cyclo-ligase [Bacillota bacterium]